MDNIITEQQQQQLQLLTKMSNMISNAVWFAEHGEKDVDGQIEMGIWLARHFVDEIELIKKTPTVGEPSKQPALS